MLGMAPQLIEDYQEKGEYIIYYEGGFLVNLILQINKFIRD